MPYNPDLYHRRSVRLKSYDYSQQGAYYVTICTFQRICLFGEIENSETRLNQIGLIVQREWLRSAQIRSNLSLDEFIIMPNHLHGIIMIESDGVSPTTPRKPGLVRPANSLSTIIWGFKSTVTKQVNWLRNSPDAPVWQRNYYEHVIRDEKDLERIREYIANNPARWAEDQENPDYNPGK